ncbi:MAG: hypothetical protein Q4A97_01890 [Comamonadaceae bacterium]|nr:hypothetical protein [Comamonadaceae bacterium]
MNETPPAFRLAGFFTASHFALLTFAGSFVCAQASGIQYNPRSLASPGAIS